MQLGVLHSPHNHMGEPTGGPTHHTDSMVHQLLSILIALAVLHAAGLHNTTQPIVDIY